jgi:Na+-transporting methylmalonyl-CoA/oxaloacetate decarboxylase gamma subunit
MVLLGLGLMLATAALIWPLDLWGRGVLSIMITVLGVSWLGTSVFQGDSIAQRIRFLADRGIAPGWVWSTRQLTPASIVSLFLLGLLIALTVSGTAADLFPLLTLLVLIIYGTSQWVAQLLPSPIISSICAPLVAAMAAAYFALSYVWFAPPWWLMAVTILIPLVATRALTRRWMDRRLGWDYLFANVGFAALMILPIAPQVVRSINEPRMPAEVKRELSAIAPPVVLGSTSTRLKELVIAGANGGTAYEVETVQSNDPPRMMADAWADKLAQVQEQLNSTQVPISVSSGAVLETLRGIAELCLIADSNPALTAAERDEGAKTYPVAVRLLSQAARRLRMSHRLIEQDMADLIEIWLINELRRAGARERLGSEIDSNVRALLGDREGRQKARERAVAASWADYQMATKKDRWTNPDQIGGYQLFDIIEPGGAWGARSRGEFAVGELWQWLRAGKQGTNPQRLERIARAWGLPPSTYGLGDTGPIWRADDLNRYVHPGFRSYKPRPGAQWFAAWEDEAEAMGRSFEGGNQESAGVPKE